MVFATYIKDTFKVPNIDEFKDLVQSLMGELSCLMGSVL